MVRWFVVLMWLFVCLYVGCDAGVLHRLLGFVLSFLPFVGDLLAALFCG